VRSISNIEGDSLHTRERKRKEDGRGVKGELKREGEGGGGHSPSFVLVELVAHALAKLFEFALLLGIVRLDEGDLEEPEPP